MKAYRKATPQEITEYAGRRNKRGNTPLYPLTHWVRVAGVECAVEGLFEDGGPKYEVMAPEGQHFNDGDILHTMLCYSLKDVLERAQGTKLLQCTHSC